MNYLVATGRPVGLILNFDEIVKSQKLPVFVIPAGPVPAKGGAGIQGNEPLLLSGLRGSAGLGDYLRDLNFGETKVDAKRKIKDLN